MSQEVTSKFYRIVTHTDEVHYYCSETEEWAKDQHLDIHDPMGTDRVDARIWGIKVMTKEEMISDMNFNQSAVCWCEDML